MKYVHKKGTTNEYPYDDVDQNWWIGMGSALLSKADPQMMRKAVATAAGRIEETDGERY